MKTVAITALSAILSFSTVPRANAAEPGTTDVPSTPLPSAPAPAGAQGAATPGLEPQVAPQPLSSSTPTEPPAPAPPPPGTFVSGDWRFAMHGIVGASVYAQDTPQFLLNGQGLLLPLAKPSSGYTTGVDVRQTRFDLSVSGPRVLHGAVPRGVIDMDLFGGDSSGSYGEVSILPRLRLAYAELDWGSDVLRFGQDLELIVAMIPESIGHLGFPITAPAGLIGWREPGVEYFHDFAVGASSKLELAVQVMRGDWSAPVGYGQTTLNNLNVDYGQLSGWPGVEARAKWTSEAVTAFVAGHYNRVAGSSAGNLVNPPTIVNAQGATVLAVPNRDWDVYAAQAGVSLRLDRLTLTGNAYAGQNTAALLGELFQFMQKSDVREWGAWGQVLFAITNELDVSAVAGTTQLNESDVEKNGGGRLSNTILGGMVRYKEHGFSMGPEFFHAMSKVIDANGNGAPSGAGAPTGDIQANQAMVSAMYIF